MSGVEPEEPPSGWRGKRSRIAPVLRYRWQKDPTAETRDPLESRDLGRRLQIGGFLALLLLLAIVLGYRLAFDPERTTFVAIGAPAYSWPLPPLAFSGEELAAFHNLNDENLQVYDVSAAWESKERGLAQLDERLAEIAARGGLDPIVIYLALHGAVDGHGEPCLAPAGASPLKTDSWLPLKELLTHLKDAHLPDQRPKLLLFDSNRLQVDWNLGIVFNTFADALSRVVEESQLPGLVAINSTGLNESAASSDDMASSVFGHFLRLGLAGAADADRDFGNGDRRVSLRELHGYLRKHVDDWALFNHNSHQRPLLIPSDARDFTLTWSFSKSKLRKFEAASADSARGAPAPASAKLVELWREHDRLRAAHAYKNDPIGYRNFEQKLLWLGRAVRAGAAYASASQRVETEVAAAAAGLDQRLRPDFSGERRGSAAVAGGSPRKPMPPAAHSIALGQYLGAIGPKTAGRLRGYLDAFRESPSQEGGATLLERFSSAPLAGLVEGQSLRLFERYLPEEAWREPAAIARVVGLRQLAEANACPGDARVQYWVRARVDAGDVARRATEDRLFVGDQGDVEALAVDAAVAEEHYGVAGALAKSCSAALALHDQAATELPYLAAWLARPAAGKRAAASADQQINHGLLRLIDANRRLGVALSSADSEQASITPDAAPWDASREEVQRELDAIHASVREEIERLADARQAKPATLCALEAALALPLLETAQRETLSRQFLRFASRLHGDYHDPKRAESGESAARETELLGDAEYLERIAIRWDEHPAIALLRRSDAPKSRDRRRAGAGADWNRAVNQEGQRLRELLASLASDVRLWQTHQRKADRHEKVPPQNSTDNADANEVADTPTERTKSLATKPVSTGAILRTREAWNGPAGWVRQAASFWFPSLDADPIPRLQRFDSQQLLLWQAQRTLDDFLGPVENQADPFFVVSTRDELTLVRQLGGATGLIGEELERLQNLLAERRRAARGGLETAATDIVLIGGAGDIPVGLQVRPGLDDAAAGLPPGLAAVYLGDARGRIANTTFSLRLPLGSGDRQDRAAATKNPRPPADGPPAAGPPVPEPPAPSSLPATPLPNASELQPAAIPGAPPEDGLILPMPGDSPLEAPAGSRPAPPAEAPPRRIPPAASTSPAPARISLPGGSSQPLAMVWTRRFEAPEEHFAGRGPLLDATALLRGNSFSTKLLLRPTGGVKIDFTRYEYGPPTISVLGRSRRRVAIEFILDCSHSMSELTPVEEPGKEGRAPRMELAKNAMEGMLDELAARGDAHVGVRFFGHRVGWNIKQPNQLLRQSDYGHATLDSLLPSEDVELVLPLGRYDPVIHGGLVELMKTVKAWGETPLYLALIQALGDFAHEDPDTERSIIVITDGVNYQFNSPSPRSREQVLTAYNALARKVPIHIVGFGIGAREAAEASREFGEIAKRTGGSYVPVTSATALVRSLEALLGSKPFHVYDALDREVGEAAVGSTIHLGEVPPRPERFSVRLGAAAAAIELAGGEAVELLPSRDGRRLESAPYDKNSPTFAPLVLGAVGPTTGIELGVHRALWRAEGVRFSFSFQHADHAFTPRPAEVWLEVAPLLAEKRLGGSTRRPAPAAAATATSAVAKSQKYIFYDVNYSPATSAPVLDWLAADWPLEARQAEIRVWAKPQATPPTWRAPLAKLVDKDDAPIGGRVLPGLVGVTYQARLGRSAAVGEPRQIAIVERHAEDGPALDALKFELSPPPERTIHRFDAEHRLVSHIFTLDAAGDRRLADYELLITRREDLQAGAWRLEEPMVIEVDDPGDLIRLAPATLAP